MLSQNRNNSDEPPSGVMTRAEVAQLFNITEKTVERRIRKRLLPKPIKGTRNPTLFARSVIMRFIGQSGNVKPRPKRSGR